MVAIAICKMCFLVCAYRCIHLRAIVFLSRIGLAKSPGFWLSLSPQAGAYPSMNEACMGNMLSWIQLHTATVGAKARRTMPHQSSRRKTSPRKAGTSDSGEAPALDPTDKSGAQKGSRG